MVDSKASREEELSVSKTMIPKKILIFIFSLEEETASLRRRFWRGS